MATIELATTFADFSLEMDPSGQKFKVSTALQEKIASAVQLATTPPSTVMDVTEQTGVATTSARADHVHSVGVGMPVALTLAGVTGPGAGPLLVHSDHVHALPGTAAPVAATLVGAANAAGSAATLARSDHTHALPAFGAAAATFAEGNDARLSNARTPTAHASTHAPNGTDPVATASATDLIVGGISAPGVANTLVRSDHTHGLASGLPVPLTAGGSGAGTAGVTPSVARSDHQHDITTAAPVTLSVGGPNTAGTANGLSRADHQHALPAFGTISNTFCQGNDARLSNARTPTAHASAHVPGGADTIFSGSYLAQDAPAWNGSQLIPRQTTTKRIGGLHQQFITTNFVDITNLNTVLNRTGAYTFDYVIFYNSGATSEGVGLQMAFTGAADEVRYTIEIYTALNVRADLQIFAAFGTNPAAQANGPGPGVEAQARISGSVNVTGVGTLSVQGKAKTATQYVTALISSHGQVRAGP